MNKTRKALIDYLENKKTFGVLLNAIHEEDIEMAKATEEYGELCWHNLGSMYDTEYIFTSKDIIEICEEGVKGNLSLHHLNMIAAHITHVLHCDFNNSNEEKEYLIKVLEPWADYINDIPLTWEIVKKTKNLLINRLVMTVNSYQTQPWININTIIA